jgi:lipoprotein NlpD
MQILTFSRWLAIGIASTLSASFFSPASVSAHPNHAETGPTIAQASCNNISFMWPAQGRNSTGFDENEYHMGLDIVAPEGTPIVAAADGEVVKAGWDDWGLGNAIKIRHDNGCYTVYGHNQENLVQVGQRVRQGEQIALMGNTGFTDRAHVHFEVRLGDQDWIDPMVVLSNASPSQTRERITSTLENTANQPIARKANATACSGEALVRGETSAFRVEICQENGQLFYLGQNKQNLSAIRLPARSTTGGYYQAENGSYSYLVNTTGYQVLRNGRPLRSERFF